MTQMLRRTVAIANGEALSEAVNIQPFNAIGVAVETPAVWTAADIGFEVSMDGTTFVPVLDANNARIIIDGPETAAAGLYVLDADLGWFLNGYRYIRLASLNTSTGANENQGDDRSLVIVFRPLA